MVKIILEKTPKGKLVIWTEELDEIAKIDGIPSGKSFRQLIKEDAAAGTDKTGNAKYRKILADHGILTENELASWRSKHQIEEKPNVGIADDS